MPKLQKVICFSYHVFFVSYFDFTQFLFIKTFTVFAEVRLIKSEQNDTAKLQFYFLFDKFFPDIFIGGG